AASYRETVLASEAMVAPFGTSLATRTQSAETWPLPTSLAGTQVLVKDSLGVERLAPLFFVSPGQINYQMPPGTATGTAMVTITSGDGAISTCLVEIAAVAPGLFSANADGQGVAAAVALRVRANGELSYELIAQYDEAQKKYVTQPLGLGG